MYIVYYTQQVLAMAPTSSLKRPKKGEGDEGAKAAVKREETVYKDQENNSDPENSPDSQVNVCCWVFRETNL